MKSSVIFQHKPTISKASLRGYSQIAVLVDQHTRAHCYPLLAKQLPPHSVIEVMAGEDHKNLVTSQVIWQHMTELGFDRHAALIIIGGVFRGMHVLKNGVVSCITMFVSVGVGCERW
jgi:3-dehydroquinate synthetase